MKQETFDMGTADGDEALKELGTRLAAIDAASLSRPHADPQAAAVTALLIADYLAQPEMSGKLASQGLTSESVTDLRRLGRAIIEVAMRLGGDYLPATRNVPGDLLERGRSTRSTVTAALAKALPDDADVTVWLDAIRLGSGSVDLVYDLRALGELCVRDHRDGQPSLSAADAIEAALREGDTPKETESRDTLARLWTLFVPAYNAAAAAGRELTRSENKDRLFPPLAVVTSQKRTRRRVSLEPAGPQSRRAAPVSFKSEDLAPPSSRRGNRHPLEIEVGIASDSNLYVGFTENLSAGGVFVATYVPKPIGSKVKISLAFPNGDEIHAKGVVRWLRDATDDGWPGMGVQFENLTASDEAALRKFLSLRDPMFYDD
jgi:uncharacterized protein (TIGR02266 family)